MGFGEIMSGFYARVFFTCIFSVAWDLYLGSYIHDYNGNHESNEVGGMAHKE